MLRLFTALFIAVCFCSCAAPFVPYKKDGKLLGVLPLENDRVVYEYRQELPKGVSRDEAFRRARRWWVNNYRSAKDVFQLTDKETGEIIGKGFNTVITKAPKGVLPRSYSYFNVISVDVSQVDYTISVYGFQVSETSLVRAGLGYELPVEKYSAGTEKMTVTFYHALDDETTQTIDRIKSYIQQPNSRF